MSQPAAPTPTPVQSPFNTNRPGNRPLPRGLPPQASPPSPRLAAFSRWATALVVPVTIAYTVFVQDWGDREHVFSPARRWLERQKRSFYTLTPEQERMAGIITADTAGEDGTQSTFEVMADTEPPPTPLEHSPTTSSPRSGILAKLPGLREQGSSPNAEKPSLLSQGRLR